MTCPRTLHVANSRPVQIHFFREQNGDLMRRVLYSADWEINTGMIPRSYLSLLPLLLPKFLAARLRPTRSSQQGRPNVFD